MAHLVRLIRPICEPYRVPGSLARVEWRGMERRICKSTVLQHTWNVCRRLGTPFASFLRDFSKLGNRSCRHFFSEAAADPSSLVFLFLIKPKLVEPSIRDITVISYLDVGLLQLLPYIIAPMKLYVFEVTGLQLTAT